MFCRMPLVQFWWLVHFVILSFVSRNLLCYFATDLRSWISCAHPQICPDFANNYLRTCACVRVAADFINERIDSDWLNSPATQT